MDDESAQDAHVMAVAQPVVPEPDAEVTGIEEAISMVEGGGWMVLEFRN